MFCFAKCGLIWEEFTLLKDRDYVFNGEYLLDTSNGFIIEAGCIGKTLIIVGGGMVWIGLGLIELGPC